MSVPKIILDDRDDATRLQQAYLRVFNASGGKINASQPGSTLMALLEGQTYLTGELLWYMNKLPEALALEVLRLTGVELINGTKAFGTLTVTLTNVLGTPFILSEGTVLGSYVTTQDMFIPAGAVEGTVQVESLSIGSRWNAKPYSIRLGAVTTYVQDIFNAGSIIGGSDVESIEAYLERVQTALRLRDTLVSEEDYNIAATTLGGGSGLLTASTFPLVKADKVTKGAGNAHIFLAYFDYSIPSVETLLAIQDTMQARCYIGSSVWVSAAEYHSVVVDVVCSTTSLSETIADSIFSSMQAYVNPRAYTIGSTLAINELEYVTRGVTGVKRVSSLFINSNGLDVGMPSYYTYPYLDEVNITLVDELGRSVTFYKGQGGGDVD